MSKKRRGCEQAEHADGEIWLGPEFQDMPCLSCSEVHHYLVARKAQQQKELKQVELKILRYTESFLLSGSAAGTIEIRKVIENSKLELFEFEIAQIANFLCERAEILKSLVPSLQRIDDNDLQELLDQISTIRKFASI